MKRKLFWVVVVTMFCALLLVRVNTSDAETATPTLNEQHSLVNATMASVGRIQNLGGVK